MSATEQKYHWIKQIPRSLLQKDEIPLVGFPPSFPWEQFSSHLAKLLGLEDLNVTSSLPPQWRTPEKLLESLGPSPKVLHLALAPQGGIVSWVMAEDALKKLLELSLFSEAEGKAVVESELVAGFYQFLALEVLQTISKVDFDPSLSFQIAPEAQLPDETALCIDISIQAKEEPFWGRLVLSPDFLKQWKARYQERRLASALDQNLNLVLHLEAGRVALRPSEWGLVQPGDFLLLDACSIDPRNAENQIKLTIHGLPLFAATIAEKGVNLLEYAQYQEGDFRMTREEDPENSNYEETDFNQEESDEEFELDETALEGLDETELEGLDETELENLDETGSEELEETETQSTVEAEESQLEALEGHEELMEPAEEEFTEDRAPAEKWPPLPERVPHKGKKEKKRAPKEEVAHEESEELHVEATEVEEAPKTLSEVPLPVIIEVGRVEMTLGKLMELQPGNFIDLKVHPEHGVDLVVQGRCIGKGELLLLGDTLGVRILEIG